MLIDGDEPICVDKITTDADGRMADGFADEMKEKGTETEHFLDTVHLNRSVAAAITRAHISPKLVTSGKCNSKHLHQAKNRLADSLAWRAEREVRGARSKFKKEKNVVTALENVIPALITCYEGNHRFCQKHSFVCDGSKPMYEYLPKYAHGAF
jgi:hypothetical protein